MKIFEKINENTVMIDGVEYKKVSKETPPTIYEFLVQCEYGRGDFGDSYAEKDKLIELETTSENFLNYLYEYCDVIEEDDDKMIVSISKSQMVIPND